MTRAVLLVSCRASDVDLLYDVRRQVRMACLRLGLTLLYSSLGVESQATILWQHFVTQHTRQTSNMMLIPQGDIVSALFPLASCAICYSPEYLMWPKAIFYICTSEYQKRNMVRIQSATIRQACLCIDIDRLATHHERQSTVQIVRTVRCSPCPTGVRTCSLLSSRVYTASIAASWSCSPCLICSSTVECDCESSRMFLSRPFAPSCHVKGLTALVRPGDVSGSLTFC